MTFLILINSVRLTGQVRLEKGANGGVNWSVSGLSVDQLKSPKAMYMKLSDVTDEANWPDIQTLTVSCG